MSSGGAATSPYYSCNVNTATTGSWSPGVTYSCESIIPLVQSNILYTECIRLVERESAQKSERLLALLHTAQLSPLTVRRPRRPSRTRTRRRRRLTSAPMYVPCHKLFLDGKQITNRFLSDVLRPRSPVISATRRTSGPGGAPYYTCVASTAAAGVWSAVQGLCNGAHAALIPVQFLAGLRTNEHVTKMQIYSIKNKWFYL